MSQTSLGSLMTPKRDGVPHAPTEQKGHARGPSHRSQSSVLRGDGGPGSRRAEVGRQAAQTARPHSLPGCGPHRWAGMGSGASGAKKSAGARAGSVCRRPPGFRTST